MALPSDDMRITGNTESHRSQSGVRAAYGEESPEALRRRADVLLDEMMLGSNDMGSGDFAFHETFTSDSPPAETTYRNGTTDWQSSEPEAPPYDAYAQAGASTPRGANGAASTANGNSNGASREHNGYSAPDHPVEGDQAPPPGAAPPTPDATRSDRDPSSRLVSAEERYAQVASGPKPGPTGSGPNGVDAFGSSPAVRRQSPTLASTMTVGVRAANRSNLLPRSMDIDSDAMRQEINDLLTTVSTTLPPGHEAVERSRHLLNKAQNLLQSDPMRSAEVDYYLQQVRRIVQRTRQTQEWSSIYRQRLTIYQSGWVLLSLVVLASLVFSQWLPDLMTALFDVSASTPFVQQAPVVMAGAFAGALGAAVAALVYMARHSRRKFGYFDRKYGLRGLLLPVMGLISGLLMAVIWAVVYAIAGVDPATTDWALLAPASVAFVVGFSQEWLYGAR